MKSREIDVLSLPVLEPFIRNAPPSMQYQTAGFNIANFSKKQPDNVNPDLWKRFLIKKKYNGTYKKYGTTLGILSVPYGHLEIIFSETL